MISGDLLVLLLAIQRQPGAGNALLSQVIQFARNWPGPLYVLAGRSLRELTALLPPGCEHIATALHQCTPAELEAAEQLRHTCQLRGIQWAAPSMVAPLQELLAPLGKEVPPLLHYRGNYGLLEKSRGGVVGAQQPSARGAALAGHCGAVLAAMNHVLVTGAAIGVDSAAVSGALGAGGFCILVMPHGLLAQSATGLEVLIQPGGPLLLLSETSPESPWLTANAVQRNRIIAVLSEWLCVIESTSAHGGARTADYAVNFQRPLFYRGGRAENRYAPVSIGHALPDSPGAEWFRERTATAGHGGMQGELF